MTDLVRVALEFADEEIKRLKDSVKAADDGREEWESSCKSAEAELEWMQAENAELKRENERLRGMVRADPEDSK